VLGGMCEQAGWGGARGGVWVRGRGTGRMGRAINPTPFRGNGARCVCVWGVWVRKKGGHQEWNDKNTPGARGGGIWVSRRHTLGLCLAQLVEERHGGACVRYVILKDLVRRVRRAEPAQQRERVLRQLQGNKPGRNVAR
jgi:hypothetical protein